MSEARPLSHPVWSRVAQQRPRLRTGVQWRRRRFRGEPGYVLESPGAAEHHRLSLPAWRFAGLLDGRRTVDEVWQCCRTTLGEQAPTQGEALQLLRDLQNANLLCGAVSPATDVEHPRGSSAARGTWLSGLITLRIPLFEPDSPLTRWAPLLTPVFSIGGLALWLALIIAGAASIMTGDGSLSAGIANAMSLRNLPLLYIALFVMKGLHEFAHAAACKVLGLRDGGEGRVGSMGILLILLAPVPFVDASSSWTLRSKRDRILVAAAGVMAEMAIASVAAMLWTATADGTALHALCYNVMLLASVSALVLNGNPLARFDGYFVLCDLLEIPNLAQRSFTYLRYLVKRHVWRIDELRFPARSGAERAWLLGYALCSGLYRVCLLGVICVLLLHKWFFVGAALALWLAAACVLVPVLRLARYLRSAPELAGRRTRATLTTVAAAGAATVAIGVVPAADRTVVDGVVEADGRTEIVAGADGIVEEIAQSSRSFATGDVVARIRSVELETRLAIVRAEVRSAEICLRIATRDRDVAGQQVAVARRCTAVAEAQRVEQQFEALTVRAPTDGVWQSEGWCAVPGRMARRGERLGAIVPQVRTRVTAAAEQAIAAQLFHERPKVARVRFEGRPDLERTAQLLEVVPAGQRQLPSGALAIAAGGSIAVEADTAGGTSALEPFFEIRLKPDDPTGLRHGQRVRVRLEFSSKPLAAQAWRGVLRLLQRKFHAAH